MTEEKKTERNKKCCCKYIAYKLRKRKKKHHSGRLYCERTSNCTTQMSVLKGKVMECSGATKQAAALRFKTSNSGTAETTTSRILASVCLKANPWV